MKKEEKKLSPLKRLRGNINKKKKNIRANNYINRIYKREKDKAIKRQKNEHKRLQSRNIQTTIQI